MREVDEGWDAPPLPMDRIEEGFFRPLLSRWKTKEMVIKILDKHYRKYCFSDDKKDWPVAFEILDIMRDVEEQIK